jgi:hypothetical protein
MRSPSRSVILAACLALGVSLAAQSPAGGSLPLKVNAFAVSLGGPQTPASAGQVEITIDRWSSPDDTARLMRTYKESGDEALLEVLRDLKPVGTIRAPGSLAWDLHYAQDDPNGDGGRHIVLATDRPVSMWEAVNRPRVSEYPFTFIELKLDDSGKGVGKLAVAAKIIPGRNGTILGIENFDTQPVRLNEVRVETR